MNNFLECFNSYILDVRDKPILTMIDTIRRKLMRRFQVNRASITKMSGKLFSKIHVVTWSRSKFSTNPKSDLIVNNLSECFNSYILDARDKPILTMVDTIRRKLMRRFQVNKASIAKMSEKLCSKI